MVEVSGRLARLKGWDQEAGRGLDTTKVNLCAVSTAHARTQHELFLWRVGINTCSYPVHTKNHVKHVK